MNSSLSNLKSIIIFVFSIFVLYNIPNLLNYLSGDEFRFDISVKNIQGQLQQPQNDYIKYHYQSNFIKEFEISQIRNNETGLKAIITDSKNNVWFFHNTNTSSAI